MNAYTGTHTLVHCFEMVALLCTAGVVALV